MSQNKFYFDSFQILNAQFIKNLNVKSYFSIYQSEFNDISSKLDVSKRDITKYSWKELETTVDANRSTRIKAGKIDSTVEDSNLLYNNNLLLL